MLDSNLNLEDIKKLSPEEQKAVFAWLKLNLTNYLNYLKAIILKRGRFNIPAGTYYEVHHIIPRAFGGLPKVIRHTSKHNNLIWLTLAEYFEAHKILALDNLNNYKVVYAFILSIDLGLDNFATCINNIGNNPFIINGKPLKSINQYFNKENAKLQAFVGDKGTSRKIKRLVFRRNNKITNYIHHCSKFVINYCISNNIGTIIIGNNKNWKIESKMSKKVNQQFIQIPFSTFINQIKHKAEENGINVILTEESYTSKIDHLALEPLEKQDTYLGKRVKRGLFQSSTGKLINADINGAIGIARKVIGDSYVNEIINRGLVFNPIRINVITNFNKGGC